MIEKLIGEMPKVGIRPIIDGRRKGIRESLEEKTMNMALSVAKLIESKLKYPNGEPVQCVIADSTIGRVNESALCEEKFRKENVGLTISVTPCWCYGSETIDYHPLRPKAIWGFNGTERPGAVYLAAALAAHNQLGIPAFGIYGDQIQDLNDDSIPADVEEKLLQFAKAGLAVSMMQNKSYLSIGSICMGIAGSDVQSSFFQKYLGMRREAVDMSEVIRRMEQKIYDEAEFEKAKLWVKKNCKQGLDLNKRENQRNADEKEGDWERSILLTMIVRDLMVGNEALADKGFLEEAGGHNALISGFQGQRQWTDFMTNGDFMESILNTSFDWNGKREPYIVATENDSLNAVSMLFGHLLTNTSQLFADVRAFWSPESVQRVTGERLEGKASDGIIHLINSGAATLDFAGVQKKDGEAVVKPFWEITDEECQQEMEKTSWYPATTEYFRGGGYSSHFMTESEMPVTMCRLNLVDGDQPVLQIAEGYTVVLPDNVSEILDKRTDPTWPTTWFAPRITGKGAFKDVYSVMNNWGANHGAISYGHIGKDLISLAALLRIPVNMHNVEEDKVFRPTLWNAYGTAHLEQADFQVCRKLGPLYGRN